MSSKKLASSSYHIYCHKVVHNIYYSCIVCWICSNVLSFISDNDNLCLARGLPILLIYSKLYWFFSSFYVQFLCFQWYKAAVVKILYKYLSPRKFSLFSQVAVTNMVAVISAIWFFASCLSHVFSFLHSYLLWTDYGFLLFIQNLTSTSWKLHSRDLNMNT